MFSLRWCHLFESFNWMESTDFGNCIDVSFKDIDEKDRLRCFDKNCLDHVDLFTSYDMYHFIQV